MHIKIAYPREIENIRMGSLGLLSVEKWKDWIAFFKGKKMSRLDQVQTDTLFKRKLIVTSIAAALGMTGAPLAIGQETSLEEVIVTARQRAESSQDVPMMIQSLSGEDVQKQRRSSKPEP